MKAIKLPCKKQRGHKNLLFFFSAYNDIATVSIYVFIYILSIHHPSIHPSIYPYNVVILNLTVFKALFNIKFWFASPFTREGAMLQK